VKSASLLSAYSRRAMFEYNPIRHFFISGCFRLSLLLPESRNFRSVFVSRCSSSYATISAQMGE